MNKTSIVTIAGLVFVVGFIAAVILPDIIHPPCKLSLCDCKCYPWGETREQRTGEDCGINCKSLEGIYDCELVDGECSELIDPDYRMPEIKLR